MAIKAVVHDQLDPAVLHDLLHKIAMDASQARATAELTHEQLVNSTRTRKPPRSRRGGPEEPPTAAVD